MEDTLTTEELLYLKGQLCREWRDVGRHLGISDTHIRHIDVDYSGNEEEKIYQMLRKWIEMKGTRATRSSMVNALQMSHRKDLVDFVIRGNRPAFVPNKSRDASSVVRAKPKTSDEKRLECNNSWNTRNTIIVVVFIIAVIPLIVSHGGNERKTNRDVTEEWTGDILEPDILEKYFLDLKNSLTEEWKDVGRFLGISHADLEHINDQYDRNPKERNFQMLHKWGEQYGTEATPEALEKVLRKVGRRDLADNLRKEIQKEKTGK